MKPDRTIWLSYEPSDEQWEALHRAADRIFVGLGELVVFRVDQPLDPRMFAVDLCMRDFKPEYTPVELAEDWDAELPLSPSVCGSRGVRLEARLPSCLLRSRGPPGLGADPRAPEFENVEYNYRGGDIPECWLTRS